MLKNLPLGGQVKGLDNDYIKKLIDYAHKIDPKLSAEDKMNLYFEGCDKEHKIIQAKVKILPP